MRSILSLLLLSIFWTPAFAQGAHRQNQVLVKGNGIQANVAPNARILVCVSGTGCASQANAYSDAGLTNLLAQPLTADSSGNYDYYITSGCVDEQINTLSQGNFFLYNICPNNGIGANGISSISVATANGFQGTSSGGSTPALTLLTDSTHLLATNTGSATTYLNGTGAYSTPAGLGGTVTSVSALSPLFSVANPTSTPTFGLSNAGAHTFFGNNTGSSATPAYHQPAFSDLSGAATTGQLPFTYSGTTTKLTTLSGSTTSNDCSKWDASGNLVDSGGPCGDGALLPTNAIVYGLSSTTSRAAVTSDITSLLGGVPVLSITTTGSSGPATLSGSTLNIPNYTGGVSGVSSLNSLTGALSVAAGSNVTVTPSGSTITIASSTGISTLTAGYLPLAGSATTLTGNSHLNDGVTTSGVITSTEPITAPVGTMPLYNTSGTAQTSPHTVTGVATLASATYTITLSGSSVFTSSTSYSCYLTIVSTTGTYTLPPVIYSSGSSFFISADSNGFSGDVRYACIGN